MCINCPDMVTDCWQPGCLGPEFLPDGRRNLYARSRKFYLDDTLCGHLQRRYGVTTGRALREFLDSRPEDEDQRHLEDYLQTHTAEYQAAYEQRTRAQAPRWRRAVAWLRP
jgi:hypothetical protein